MDKPHIIAESPNKDDISYVVQYLQKNVTSVSSYFKWLTDEVKDQGISAARTIVCCQTIKQCAMICSVLKSQLGEYIYEDPRNRDTRRVVLEMLHSFTPVSNKIIILDSFVKEDGCIKVLIVTIAFGIGIDCKKVYRTIHFGQLKTSNHTLSRHATYPC